jgi:hypothetical protein
MSPLTGILLFFGGFLQIFRPQRGWQERCLAGSRHLSSAVGATDL